MPKSKPKKQQAAPPAPLASEKTAVGPNGKPIIYPKLDIIECSTASERGPMTVQRAKDLMGWETEKQYQARKMKEKPGSVPTEFIFGDDFHCVNAHGEKVRCWNNAGNRPFDLQWCEALRDTTLYGQWAGPHTVPGETVNGETIRISRYGEVESGQHSLTGLIFADELLQKERGDPKYDPRYPKYPFWNGHEHPFIETILITGLSSDERILRTIDYVKPRTVADMLFTMPLYKDNKPAERRELTRMLSAAVNLLWDRTDAQGYMTHPEVVGFIERHSRLLKAVEHLFIENRDTRDTDGGRRISKLKLNPGHMAALAVLMGASGPKTDGDFYRRPKSGGAPSEKKHVDWSLWQRALEFFTRLASYDDEGFAPLRKKLATLLPTSSPSHPTNQGLGGKADEKLVVLAKAWEVYKDHPEDEDGNPPFNKDDIEDGGALMLNYSDHEPPTVRNGETIPGKQLPDGMVRLTDVADFDGIDCPPKNHEANIPPAPTKDDIWADGGLADQARKRREAMKNGNSDEE